MYCSDKCKYRFHYYRKKEKDMLYCLWCYDELTDKYKYKFCSDKCRWKFNDFKQSMNGRIVSQCCEAPIKATVKGYICKECDRYTFPATLFNPEL